MKLLWDFFGPHAERTASHFKTHLEQFLSQHALTGLTTGLESAGDGHKAAYCVAQGDALEKLKASLRPNRALPAP
jgi:Mn-containing catalase